MMQSVFDFLYDLSLHNDREWFNANKERYLEANNIFNGFAMDLAKRLEEADPQVGRQQLKDMTYRIYRDVRFSKYKHPYKTHFGAFICRGGKKSPYSGYYFQVGVEGQGNFEGANLLATGDYIIDPKALRVLREDISMGNGEFGKLVRSCDPRFEMDFEGCLKKIPAGFPADCPDADYLRLKKYCVCYDAPDSFMTSPNLLDRTVNLFKTTTPLLHYINRGIEYAVEEQESEVTAFGDSSLFTPWNRE
ncbi:MAG: DUF2461 domain-containing protein [Candidatus Cryptobacteroides sp.]